MAIQANEAQFQDYSRPIRRRDNIQDTRWPSGWWILPMAASGAWLWYSLFVLVFGS
ncbi:MAG: hypothetical protein AB8B54_11400 [Sphingorhabdus sp.]